MKIRVVSAASNLGSNIDMMALWPNDLKPTHPIACNEQGPAQPAVQRIRISDGFTETILTGMTSCDPAHRTPWGTVSEDLLILSKIFAISRRRLLDVASVSADRRVRRAAGVAP